MTGPLPPNLTALRDTRTYNACRQGVEPAEILPPLLRQQLVQELHGAGWTDAEIAAHTRLTTYTVARIRARFAPPNPPRQQLGGVA
ncbi:hypothetical protein D5S17_32880 [Pseudonocardiaceae bacterium YIM PH 21723]|nr:hypothetical protein D5S17_32880 [Pseudonocardiaceae bacterium YIM PH 21723]